MNITPLTAPTPATSAAAQGSYVPPIASVTGDSQAGTRLAGRGGWQLSIGADVGSAHASLQDALAAASKLTDGAAPALAIEHAEAGYTLHHVTLATTPLSLDEPQPLGKAAEFALTAEVAAQLSTGGYLGFPSDRPTGMLALVDGAAMLHLADAGPGHPFA